MRNVVLDCGGFKRIVPTDKPRLIKDLKDKFNATIEGDELGRAKMYSDEEVSQRIRGAKPSVPTLLDQVLSTGVKPAPTVQTKAKGGRK